MIINIININIVYQLIIEYLRFSNCHDYSTIITINNDDSNNND